MDVQTNASKNISGSKDFNKPDVEINSPVSGIYNDDEQIGVLLPILDVDSIILNGMFYYKIKLISSDKYKYAVGFMLGQRVWYSVLIESQAILTDVPEATILLQLVLKKL